MWEPLNIAVRGQRYCRWEPASLLRVHWLPTVGLLPVHCGVFSHVLVPSVDPDGVVDDPVHDRVGVDA